MHRTRPSAGFLLLFDNEGEVQTGRTPVSKAGCSGFDAHHPRQSNASEAEVDIAQDS